MLLQYQQQREPLMPDIYKPAIKILIWVHTLTHDNLLHLIMSVDRLNPFQDYDVYES